jgi:long-chain acyl-CoA synthetase
MDSLWPVFQRTVARVPERPALIVGEEKHSFSAWAQRVDEFRVRYLAAELEAGDRVLLWVENCFDIAAALVAAWGCGAIPVLMDSQCRRPQLLHALASVDAHILVHHKALPEGAIPACPVVLCTKDVPKLSGGHNLPDPSALPGDPASIVFTSGSSGPPKGVVQSHQNLCRGCRAVYDYLHFRDEDLLLCPVPWSFDYGYGQLLSSIVCGLPQVLPTVTNPFGICEAIEAHHPTLLAGTPSLFAYLLGGMSPIERTELSSVRTLTSTGGRMAEELITRLLQQFPKAELILNYGLTETYRSCHLPFEKLQDKPGSIGVPIPGVDLVIVREDGSLAEANEEGEIVHRGDYVFLGYWGDAQASSRVLRPDPLPSAPLDDEQLAVYTGDLGYRDEEGYFYFLGRSDQQIKSMGVRVSPTEVEDLLLQSSLVSHAAVFAIPHELMGQEIWAAVVPQDNQELVQRDLVVFARTTMSMYMQPRKYLVLESLPRTTTGKVNYQTLIEAATSPPD